MAGLPISEVQSKSLRTQLPWLWGGVLLLLVICPFIPLFGFWVVDCGTKYLEMINIAERHSFRRINIDYPLQSLDPEFILNDATTYHSNVLKGRLYTQYPPAFPFISGVLYRLVGKSALRIIPLISAVVLLFLISRLAVLCGVRRPEVAALIAIFATPLLPYAFEFWETLPALVPAVAALVLLGNCEETGCWRRAAFGGVCAGAAFAIREQYLLWGLCLSVSLPLLYPRGLKVLMPFTCAWILVCSAVMLCNLHFMGHPLFSQVWIIGSDKILSWNLETRAETLRCYLAKFSNWDLFGKGDGLVDWLLLLAVSSIGFIASRKPLLQALTLIGVMFALLLHVINWTYRHPISAQFHFNSVLASSPIILAALGCRARDGEPVLRTRKFWKMATVATLLFIASSVFLSPLTSAIGLGFGPRMLLIAYPVLTVGAWQVLQIAWLDARNLLAAPLRDTKVSRSRLKARTIQFCVVVIIAAGVGDSLVFLRRLYMKKRFAAGLMKLIKDKAPLPVLTDVDWLRSEMTPLYYDRPILHFKATAQKDLGMVVARKLDKEAALVISAGEVPLELRNAAELTPVVEVKNIPYRERPYAFRANIARWRDNPGGSQTTSSVAQVPKVLPY